MLSIRSAARTCSRNLRRGLHTVPEMHHLNRETGIPGLLSPQGLEVGWFQYQQHLVDKLNHLTNKTAFEDYSAFQIIQELSNSDKEYLSQSAVRMLYQVAGQLYNNEFFFRSLKESVNAQHASIAEPNYQELRFVDISKTTQTTEVPVSGASSSSSFSSSNGAPSFIEDTPSTTFENLIKSSFESFLSFRELLVNKGDAMFGAGQVWLVQDTKEPALYVVNTYNAGTPFDKKFLLLSEVESPLVPLLSISTWQHVYLHDYGFAGKRRYLENAFDCINWNMVIERMPVVKPLHAVIRPNYQRDQLPRLF